MSLNFDYSSDSIIPDSGVLSISGNGAVIIPIGDTNSRPSVTTNGMLRHNINLDAYEVFYSGDWYILATNKNVDTWVRTGVTTSTYNIQIADFYIGVNYSGNVTLTLPDGIEGKRYIIKDESGKSSRNRITITTSSNQTIDGQNSVTLALNYGALTIVFGETQWHIY